jgi:Ni,Fe-hydrogenase III large subunit
MNINVNDPAFVDYCVGLTEQVCEMADEISKAGEQFERMCVRVEKLFDMLDTLSEACHDINELNEVPEDEDCGREQVESSNVVAPAPESINGYNTSSDNLTSAESRGPSGYNGPYSQYHLPIE